MIKCLAQGHKCHGRDSNPHYAANTRPEPESGKLDRSATTPHIVNGENTLNELVFSRKKRVPKSGSENTTKT